VYDDTAQHAAAIADLFWEEVMRIVGRVVLVSVLLFIVRGGHGAAAFKMGRIQIHAGSKISAGAIGIADKRTQGHGGSLGVSFNDRI